MAKPSVPLLERFQNFLPYCLDENICWEWQGSRLKAGYGKILGGPPAHKTFLAHRIAWEAHNAAPVPEGMLVCHVCDNPPCVNPFHLFLGDHRDNAIDMISKGRSAPPIGEDSLKSKLSESQILEIRTAGSIGESQDSIAARYNICRQSVSLILRGKTWKHLPLCEHVQCAKPRGELHSGSRLTESDIVAIRQAAADGLSRKETAKLYGITPENVSSIVLRKTWKHVP